jgi:carotenoid 1,2-hydratase
MGSYKWWYFDALSDDGRRGLTAILFLGSAFSPDYAARLRRGEKALPDEHVAVNLALYENGKQRAWVMSEYGRQALHAVDPPAIGGSRLEPTSGGLRLHIRDRSAPFLASLAGAGSRIEGTLDLEPFSPAMPEVFLDSGKQHRWQVIVPRGRVKVRFTQPDFSFDGVGYHDINAGDSRLEAAFSRWSWARFHDEKARTFVLYFARETNGGARALVVDAADDDPDEKRRPVEVAPGPEGSLRHAGWGLKLPSWFSLQSGGRVLRCESREMLQVAPFYCRYSAELSDGQGRVATGMGEFLDLEKFSRRGIQFLLRFKTRVS